jgi:two-component system, chemotaxis family, chemotaxis protein CheY
MPAGVEIPVAFNMFSRYRVLVVDDYVAMSRLLRSILLGLGFGAVDLAPNGGVALERLREDHYGLVFSDLHMEPMSGLVLLREIRKDSMLRSLPFIMITGTAAAQEVTEAKKQGANDYIVKPFTADIVQKKVLAVLGNHAS